MARTKYEGVTLSNDATNKDINADKAAVLREMATSGTAAFGDAAAANEYASEYRSSAPGPNASPTELAAIEQQRSSVLDPMAAANLSQAQNQADYMERLGASSASHLQDIKHAGKLARLSSRERIAAMKIAAEDRNRGRGGGSSSSNYEYDESRPYAYQPKDPSTPWGDGNEESAKFLDQARHMEGQSGFLGSRGDSGGWSGQGLSTVNALRKDLEYDTLSDKPYEAPEGAFVSLADGVSGAPSAPSAPSAPEAQPSAAVESLTDPEVTRLKATSGYNDIFNDFEDWAASGASFSEAQAAVLESAKNANQEDYELLVEIAAASVMGQFGESTNTATAPSVAQYTGNRIAGAGGMTNEDKRRIAIAELITNDAANAPGLSWWKDNWDRAVPAQDEGLSWWKDNWDRAVPAQDEEASVAEWMRGPAASAKISDEDRYNNMPFTRDEAIQRLIESETRRKELADLLYSNQTVYVGP